MQKIATRVFICASIAFGFIGILLVIAIPSGGGNNNDFRNELSVMFVKFLFALAFIILPSLALSIAGKYLNNKS